MKSINPWNGEVIFEHRADSDSIVNNKIIKAEVAFSKWRKLSFEKRAEKLEALAQKLEAQKAELAILMTREMGKPIKQAEAEIEKCAWVCRYYAKNAAAFLSDEIIQTDAQKSFVRHNPLGVLLGIMPWNFPFWQFFRFAAPSVMAGNTVLLKHASSVMQCAKAIEKLFLEADFPEGVAQSLIIPSSAVQSVIENPVVKAVSLTGSEFAGAKVASQAGAKIKKTLLELGGSNAFIVFEDADIEMAAEKAVWARYQNTGQSCIAGKRFLVQEQVYEAFKTSFIEKLEKLKFGNPEETDTKIGPMASVKLAEELEKQLQESVKKGAQLTLGGNRNGAKFEPTILEKIKPGMPAFDEELFGPVAAFSKFSTEEEAVKLSNESNFGLGVSICTNDKSRIKRLIDQMDEGAVFFNELVKSDPRLPFGGIKNSGYGRELSKAGIVEFVNQKTVYIA
ncbi:MAG: NAD-dependent succinate-semialdehyde dehydrogenase [Chitinophagales bacterium]